MTSPLSLTQPSPFDEALSRPFLDDKGRTKKKKWTTDENHRTARPQPYVRYEPPLDATATATQAQSCASLCSSLSSQERSLLLKQDDTEHNLDQHAE
jgi:hypothetical protein